MSDNIQIRPACLEDAAAIARLQVGSYRSAYAGIFPQDYLDQLSNNEQQGDRIEPLTSATSDVILVAAEGDARLAGYAVGRQQASFAAPYDSELASLHVCKALHRRGFGRMLVSAIAASLPARGCRAMMLWVLEANPARAFCERLGATLLEGRNLTVEVCEVAYGWPDIRVIASASPTPGGRRLTVVAHLARAAFARMCPAA